MNPLSGLIYITGMKNYGKYFCMVATGFALGCYYDRHDTNRMIIYRDKSALYGKELKEGELPSWPSREMWWN